MSIVTTGSRVSDGDQRPMIDVAGDLDIFTSPQLREAITDLLHRHPRTICVQLANVGFVDSWGVTVLAGGYKRAQAQGCAFVIRCPSRAVRRALSVTQLERFIAIED